MNYSQAEIWAIIILLGAGTFLIRFSFLGAFGRITIPGWAIRLLRYTPVAILPGMVAPLVIWPAETGGAPDPVRIVAALVALGCGVYFKNILLALAAGAGSLALLSHFLG